MDSKKNKFSPGDYVRCEIDDHFYYGLVREIFSKDGKDFVSIVPSAIGIDDLLIVEKNSVRKN